MGWEGRTLAFVAIIVILFSIPFNKINPFLVVKRYRRVFINSVTNNYYINNLDTKIDNQICFRYIITIPFLLKFSYELITPHNKTSSIPTGFMKYSRKINDRSSKLYLFNFKSIFEYRGFFHISCNDSITSKWTSPK